MSRDSTSPDEAELWVPRLRLELSRQKLQGVHPVDIMCAEVEQNG